MKYEKLYRVEIVEIESGEVASVIGEHLDAKQAETRWRAGISRINDKCFVRVVEE